MESIILKEGGVGVIPTDTLYGIVGSALNPGTVERIYKLRIRTPDRPMIILISSIEDLKLFGVKLDQFTEEFLNNNWPNPLSVVLPCPQEKFKYLHRGSKTLAFRIPNNKELLETLKKSGPLVAPSANFEGEKPAETVEEAKVYFGDKVDFYIDKGRLTGLPSTLVSIKNGKISKASQRVEILRQGIFTLSLH